MRSNPLGLKEPGGTQRYAQFSLDLLQEKFVSSGRQVFVNSTAFPV